MSWTARLVLAAVLAGVSAARPPLAPAQREPSSIVIVTGQQATMPVPTLMEGAQNTPRQQRDRRPPLSPARRDRARAGHRGRPGIRAAARAGAGADGTRSPWCSSSTRAPAGTTAPRSPPAT